MSPSPDFKFTPEQQAILDAPANANVLVTGAPGTGRTAVLVEKVATLLEAGAPEGTIAVATFSWRGLQYMTERLKERLGEGSFDQIQCATIRDYAEQAVERSGEKVNIADYLTVRRLLREAMSEHTFPGTVDEAEHVVRTFKSQAQRPEKDAPHHDVLQTYQTLLNSRKMTDRHDIIRQHIMGINQKKYQPLNAKYLLIDNIQDATQIQLLWLLEQINAGLILTAFGNDDECVFGRDGALGAEIFTSLKSTLSDIREFPLTQDFVLTSDIGAATDVLVAPLEDRIEKKVEHIRKGKTPLKITKCDSPGEELSTLTESLPKLLENGDRIAILTGPDSHALFVERALQQASLVHSSFAQSLWRTPPALVMMDLLHVLLNKAEDNQLRNVLISFGFSRTIVDTLFSRGLLAHDWILEPEKLPKDIDLAPVALSAYGAFCRKMKGYFKALTEWHVPPKEVFKAAALELIEKMHGDEKSEALLVVDALVHMKGKMVDFLPKLRQRRPSSSSAQLIVSTVHQVRNMSFDHVFIPFCNQEVWPYKGYNILGEDEAAERRQFYFAVTRARKSLTLLYSGEPSPFAVEVYEAYRNQKSES